MLIHYFFRRHSVILLHVSSVNPKLARSEYSDVAALNLTNNQFIGRIISSVFAVFIVLKLQKMMAA
jgi:hypothetical protein